jgi:gliding motility-associated-like protein
MKLRILLSFFLLYVASLSQAQMQVSSAALPPFTPGNLITNYFLGDGVTVLSISYEGSAKAVGYFDKSKTAVGIQRGIAMTTGRVEADPTNLNVKGIANPGAQNASTDNGFKTSDPDIAKLVKPGQSINDMAKYTIQFIPTSDTLRFKYVFASEEYPEFACSAYNDVFGFFISGPGINGTFQNNGLNIALVPGTNLPVSIDNIHPQNGANCPPKNDTYYINNNGSNKQPIYDGMTQVFTAEAIVTPCQVYTIKLIIADASDGILDSGVFLEAKSFGTGALKVLPTSVSLDGTVVEGCTSGQVTFRLPKKVDKDYNVDAKILGTAKNGVDFTAIPTKIIIPQGDSTITFPIIPLSDGLVEGTESIGFDVQIDICHRDTFWLYIKDNKIVKPNLGKDTLICKGSTFIKDATLPIPIPPPLVFSNKDSFDINTVTPFTPNTPATISSIKVFGVQPVQLQAGMIESVCINAVHQWIDDIDAYLVAPNGQFIALTTDNGGSGGNGIGLDYYKNTCFKPDAKTPITAGTVPFTGAYQPEDPWSDLWSVKDNPANGTWKLQILDDQTGAQGKLLDWTITFKSYYKINYDWTPKKGLSCYDCPNPIFKPDSTTTYIVNAADNYGCPVSDTITVYVEDSLRAPKVICGIVTHESVQFGWQPVLFAKGYEVSVNGGPWIPPTNVVSHKITGLPLLTSVTIRVRAIGQCGGKIGTQTCQTLNCVSAVPKVDNLTNISCFGKNDGSVKISATNGLAPYTFKLGTQSNANGFFTKLSPGIYTVSVEESAGCVAFAKIEILEPTLLKSKTEKDSVTCFKGSDATGIILASGGTKPYKFQWNNGVTDSIALGLSAKKYLITVTDANACVVVDSVRVFEPAEIKLTSETVDVKCYGDSTGTAKILPTGGEQPFTYVWDTNKGLQIFQKAVQLLPGFHYVTVTDNRGCQSKSKISIASPEKLETKMTRSNIACNGEKNGTAQVSVKGGTAPYFFEWNNPTSSKDTLIKNLVSGVYTVKIKDSNSCVIKDSIAIQQPDSLKINLSTTDPKCYGEAKGIAEVKPSGGTTPYTVAWSNGTNGKNIVDDLKGNQPYTVVLTDLRNCKTSQNFTLTYPDSIKASFVIKPSECNGVATGAIKSTISGGKSPYQTAWSGNGISANTPDVINLKSGTYNLEITDANLCKKIYKVEVAEPNPVVINSTVADVKCKGEATGAIKLEIQGGTTPYAYLWQSQQKTKDISGLKAGDFTVTVTDGKGCQYNKSYTVKEPAKALSSSITVIDTLCFGAKGTATIAVSGGTAPYDIVWSNAEKTAIIKDLIPGKYNTWVSDANNCEFKDSTTLYALGEVTVKLSQTAASCFQVSDGKAQIDNIFYDGKKAPISSFTYQWSNATSDWKVEKLMGDQTYTVVVKDKRGCSGSNNIKITQPAAIKVSATNVILPKCYGDANGEITVKGEGGNPPFGFLWDANAANQVGDKATKLKEGLYLVTVSDAKGCNNEAQIKLNEPKKLKADYTLKNLSCPQTPTGAIEIFGNGGTFPYSYLWSTKDKTNLISSLLSGTYKVTISDANSCKFDTTIYVSQPPPLELTLDKKDVTCFGFKNGTIKALMKGGTPPFLYSFNNENFSGQNTFNALKPNIYNLTVKDKNGCLFNEETVINEPTPMTVNLEKDTSIFYGDSIRLFPIIKDTVGKIKFYWTPFDLSYINCANCRNPIVRPKVATLFNLQVVDSQGCIGNGAVNIYIKTRDRALVPTGFSPNEDGTNDVLLIHAEKGTKVLYFSIFDQWGEQVYATQNGEVNDEKTGWDGKFRGSYAPDGVYVWTLTVQFINGEKRTFRGSTQLLRN